MSAYDYVSMSVWWTPRRIATAYSAANEGILIQNEKKVITHKFYTKGALNEGWEQHPYSIPSCPRLHSVSQSVMETSLTSFYRRARSRTSVAMKRRIIASSPPFLRGYGKYLRQCHCVTSNHVSTVIFLPAEAPSCHQFLWAVRPHVTSNGQGLVFVCVSASPCVTRRMEAV